MSSTRNIKTRKGLLSGSRKNRRRPGIPKPVIAVLCLGIGALGIFSAVGNGIKAAQPGAQVAAPMFHMDRMASSQPKDILSGQIPEQPAASGTAPVAIAEPQSVTSPSTVSGVKLKLTEPANPTASVKPVMKTGSKTTTAVMKTDLGIKVKHDKAPKPAQKTVDVSGPRVTVSVKPAHAPVKHEDEVSAVQVTEKPAVVVPARESVKAEAIPSFENTASGAEPESNVKIASEKTAEPPMWRTLLSVFINLILVVVLAYVSILGLKWFTSQRQKPSQQGAGLKLVETLNLGANRSLHVVECAGKTLLLASTPNQVNLITESEPGPVVEQEEGKRFDTYLQNSIASKSQIDSAATKVGQALRDGASFLLKRASQSRSSSRKSDDEKYA